MRRSTLTQKLKWTWILGFVVLIPQSTFAWDQHQFLMPLILNGTSPGLKQILNQSGHVPCESEDRSTLQTLIQELDLNPSSQLPRVTPQKCGPLTRFSVSEILLSGAVDDPDRGIDQNLPSNAGNRYDPHQDRKWMGGTEGPTSQGFRHMYFGGWKFLHPITTFQIPIRPLGQAPHRVESFSQKSKELIRSGNLAWGVRTLGWAMHYIQDLAQPFHSAQAISLKMVPWLELFTWPLSLGFERLVKETTRTITNYHWAYEGYVRDLVKQGNNSPFFECFTQPEKFSRIQFNPKTNTPIELAYAVSNASIQIASQVGSAELQFFGSQLLQSGVDFTKHLEMINNAEYAIRPDLSEPRERLHQVTCQALANAALGTRLMIEWAFDKDSQ